MICNLDAALLVWTSLRATLWRRPGYVDHLSIFLPLQSAWLDPCLVPGLR